MSGDDQQVPINDPSLSPLVASSRRLPDGSIELTLIDGTTETVKDSGDRITGTINPLFGPGMSTSEDDVTDYRHATVTSGMTLPAGDPGASSKWDVNSIADAERWLRSHADTLARLWHGMDDIPDKLGDAAGTAGGAGTQVGGDDGQKASLGTFEWANKLAAQHAQVFGGVKDGLKAVIENLLDAADTVKAVAENYKNAEQRNNMNTTQMEKLFTDQTQSTHDF
jgi:hypothetical protein